MILALALALIPQTPAPQATHRVRVVRGPQKELVEGAEIRSFVSPEYVGVMLGDSFYDRLEPALEHAVPIGASDARGEFGVPVGGRCVVVEARLKDLWGIGRIDLADGVDQFEEYVREIELYPDFDLEMRVVDAHDQPLAGIPVAYRSECRSETFGYRSDELVRTSDAHGTALLHHVGFWMHIHDGGAEYRQLVAIAGSIQPAVESAVDLAHPPTQPIVLRMPPTGEVELAFEEADGTTIPMRGACALVAAKSAKEVPTHPPVPLLGVLQSDMDVVANPAGAAVVFRRVSLDGDWDVWVQRNPASKAVRARVRGPHAEGEHVRVVVHPPEVALLQGQFTDERGAPRSEVEFTVLVRWTPPSGGWPPPPPGPDGITRFIGNIAPYADREFTLGGHGPLHDQPVLRTDDHGRFRIDLDAACYDLGELFLTFVEKRGEAGERSVRVRWEKHPNAGLVDLGKLALPPSPVIASGSVRDEAGHPLAGVLVEGSSCGYGFYRFTTKSLADGTFCLRGACFEEYTDLRFTLADYTDTVKVGVVEMGTKDLTVVMRKNEAEKK